MFPEDEFKSIDEQNKLKNEKVSDGGGGLMSCFRSGEKEGTSKVYKIKYSLNLLPSIGTYIDKDRDLYTDDHIV